jgi:hypothetical protein
MKTLMLRVCYLGLAVSTILAVPGAKDQAKADVPDPVADVLKPLEIADVDADDADFPAPLAGPGDTNAPAKPPVTVQEPTAPENLKVSPALAEVIKLVQAGVGPDVLMAYVTNSTAVFNIDSDTIVYLKDLGLTNTVITALIQHDASPETAARRASATAVQPLPPGVAATAPITNIYPPSARAFPVAGQTQYPGDFANVTDTNESTNLPPAVEAPLTPPNENVTVNNFYSSLAPYGTWMDVDGYGLCWRPTVAVGDPYWRPYSHAGRWLWSDSGWYWYSDYSWGWAPFHYGRWCSYPRVGWIWVPGSVWAPSWVTWRYTDGYCGWAPLPPGCGWRSGFGLTWYGRGVSVGFDFGLGWHCYNYVPIGRFCDWNVSRHCLPENRLRVVHHTSVNINKVVVRNNNIVNNGIEPNTIARATRTKIPTMRVRDAAMPVGQGVKPERLENSGNSMALVRPKLPKNPPPAPTLANAGRNASTQPQATRGTATPGKPFNLGNAVAQTPDTRQNGNARPPQANAAVPRANANNNPAPIVREQGNAQRHNSVAIAQPNAGARTEPQNQAPAQVARPQQAPTQAAPRQQAAPNPMARNNAVPNTAPPVVRNTPPTVRNVAPPQNPLARPVPPPQAAPRNNNNNMIRSYANPQQGFQNPGRPAASVPFARPQAPMASPQPAARPQFSAPASRPSVSAPSQSAPSRSAPSGGSGGGGGGGGNRSSGGGNSGGGGGKGGRDR